MCSGHDTYALPHTLAHERQAHASTDVQHAELLERWLMEGAYNKVLAARDSMPDPAYAYFMQRLLNTVRCGPMAVHASTWQALESLGAL